MAETDRVSEADPEVKLYIGVIMQQTNANAATYPLGMPLLGMPGETMEQLAGRLQNSIIANAKNYQGLGYFHTGYIGELTHELTPPPPPPPVPINKIKALPTSMTGRKASPLKRTLKQVVGR